MESTGYQYLVDLLKAEDVKHVFGVIGAQILNVLDVLYQTPEIQYIQSQQEQTALFMASGYARTRVGAGVCLVSSGPAISNAMTGMAQAYYGSTPTILIGGEEPTTHSGMGAAPHHDLDSLGIMEPVTKLAVRVERADRLGETMRRAFRTALAGRKGPVYVGIPTDVLASVGEFDDIIPPQRYRTEAVSQGEPDAITRAVDLLLGAERPVLLAGGGILWAQAHKELRELAELLTMPVAGTIYMKGVVPEDNSLALGTVGLNSPEWANKAIQSSDLLLAIGCTFGQFTTFGFGHRLIPKAAKLIQVDIDGTEIGKIYPVDEGIVGDAKAVLRQIIDQVRERGGDRRPAEESQRVQELLKSKQAWRDSFRAIQASNKVPIQRWRLLTDLRKALSRDTIVGADSGGTHKWFHHAFECYVPMAFHGPWHALGAEIPEAIGGQVAAPDQQVVCITGDGSFMYYMQELATAVKYNIAVLYVVCHNNFMGNELLSQIERYEGRIIGTDIPVPNLANIAREFGAYGERVEEPSDIIPAVRRALASGRPGVLDIVVDTSPENLSPPSGVGQLPDGWQLNPEVLRQGTASS